LEGERQEASRRLIKIAKTVLFDHVPQNFPEFLLQEKAKKARSIYNATNAGGAGGRHHVRVHREYYDIGLI
jgi:hypothetical protein